MQRIYLDYAAATPVDERVMKAMGPYFSDIFYNPSGLYRGSLEAKKALDSARSTTAQLIGAKPSEVIFTAGGTESANLAIKGVMDAHSEGHIVVSSIEHEAVIKPAENYEHSYIKVDSKGRVSPAEIKNNIQDNTVMVSIMLANNEIGTVQPISEISAEISKLRQSRKNTGNKTPLYFYIDACQAPLYLDINVARLGVDMMTLNGGKIYGPKQSGILYKKSHVILSPVNEGGGQEFGFRSGTENVAFAVGFAKALELSEKGKANRSKEMIKLREFFMGELEQRFNAEITGHRTHRLAQNVHAIIPDIDNERVLFSLDDLGIEVAIGSACSASSDEASHVLKAIGKTEEEARRSLRFSFGVSTTMSELQYALKMLENAIKA
jgi:cysteine desulfurase